MKSNKFTRRFFLLLIALAFCSNEPSDAALISEFQPNPPGIDAELQRLELTGAAGTSFSGVLLGIGGESGRIGRVDYAASIIGVFDERGILTADIGDLFEPTLTVVLADSFSGTVFQTDVDSDNDGIADNLSSIGMIQDALGLADNIPGQSFLYGLQLGGQNFGFTGSEPQLVFRDGGVGQWLAINNLNGSAIHNINGENVAGQIRFDTDPFQTTFGQINPSSISAIPEPSAAVLASSLLIVGIMVRKRRRVPSSVRGVSRH